MVEDASANAMAPRKPLTKSIHAWFCGTRAAGFRQRLICPVTGKTFNARPIKHPIRAMTAKGIVLHAWLSKNIATPTYTKTNVSASVARTFQILGASRCDSAERLGLV